jgi:uncharacterized protein YneF (UPF0154 family)
MFNKKSITIMLSVIVILLIFIGGVFVWQKYFVYVLVKNQPVNNNISGSETPSAASIAAGQAATQNLINEVKTGAASGQSPSRVVTVDQNVDGKSVPVQAVSVAKGTSPIAVDSGQIIAKSGDVAQNSVTQGEPSSPTQSVNIDQAQLPKDAIVLSLNKNQSITPNSFTVYPGQAVVLAVTDNTPWSETIIFKDPSLAAIGFSLLPNTTRAMTFNAPTKPGNYVFASDYSVQADAGMKGVMIVK